MPKESVNVVVKGPIGTIHMGGMAINGPSNAVKISIAGKEDKFIKFSLADGSAAKQLSLNISEKRQLDNMELMVEKVRIVDEGSLYPIYDGETTVTPDVNSQTLPTMHTRLADDIVVEAIPYRETSNLSGGYTVTIGV